MKPSEYCKPKIRCIKEFTFNDSNACEFIVPVGKILSNWFYCNGYYKIDIENDYCFDWCQLTPYELDEYFEIYN